MICCPHFLLLFADFSSASATVGAIGTAYRRKLLKIRPQARVYKKFCLDFVRQCSRRSKKKKHFDDSRRRLGRQDGFYFFALYFSHLAFASADLSIFRRLLFCRLFVCRCSPGRQIKLHLDECRRKLGHQQLVFFFQFFICPCASASAIFTHFSPSALLWPRPRQARSQTYYQVKISSSRSVIHGTGAVAQARSRR